MEGVKKKKEREKKKRKKKKMKVGGGRGREASKLVCALLEFSSLNLTILAIPLFSGALIGHKGQDSTCLYYNYQHSSWFFSAFKMRTG